MHRRPTLSVSVVRQFDSPRSRAVACLVIDGKLSCRIDSGWIHGINSAVWASVTPLVASAKRLGFAGDLVPWTLCPCVRQSHRTYAHNGTKWVEREASG